MVQWGRTGRERRIRRLTDPLHAPEVSATSNPTTSAAAGDQATTRPCITGAASPEESGSVLVLRGCPMSMATGLQILRRRDAGGGMDGKSTTPTTAARAQRIRRMWTDCTSPNNAKYTISPDPP